MTESSSMLMSSRAQGEEKTGPTTEIYADPNARKILQFLLPSPRTPIAPEILPTDEIHYPQLKGLIELGPAQTVGPRGGPCRQSPRLPGVQLNSGQHSIYLPEMFQL